MTRPRDRARQPVRPGHLTRVRTRRRHPGRRVRATESSDGTPWTTGNGRARAPLDPPPPWRVLAVGLRRTARPRDQGPDQHHHHDRPPRRRLPADHHLLDRAATQPPTSSPATTGNCWTPGWWTRSVSTRPANHAFGCTRSPGGMPANAWTGKSRQPTGRKRCLGSRPPGWPWPGTFSSSFAASGCISTIPASRRPSTPHGWSILPAADPSTGSSRNGNPDLHRRLVRQGRARWRGPLPGRMGSEPLRVARTSRGLAPGYARGAGNLPSIRQPAGRGGDGTKPRRLPPGDGHPTGGGGCPRTAVASRCGAGSGAERAVVRVRTACAGRAPAGRSTADLSRLNVPGHRPPQPPPGVPAARRAPCSAGSSRALRPV